MLECGIPQSQWDEPLTAETEARIEDYLTFAGARRALLAALDKPAWTSSPERFAYRGLAQRISFRVARPEDRKHPTLPFGWRYAREGDRASVLLMPLWLFWIDQVRRWWTWWVFHPLTRLGLWDLKEDGGYWLQGRWNWRWWHGEDRAFATIAFSLDPTGFRQYQRRNWWMRLGWWIEEHTAHVQMPRWT